MKSIKSVTAFLMIFCFVFGMFCVGSAAAYNLSLQATSDGTTDKTQFVSGEDLYLNIVVDNAGGVAGCAFMLNYPADVLTAPATSAEGTSEGITSLFPFSFTNPDSSLTDTHRENSLESGKIYFAGAEIDTTDGGAKYNSGEIVLFTVKFKVNNDAPVGNFNLSLTQTELWNLDAGYGIDNNSNGQYDDGVDQKDNVPVLVGALDNQDANWGGDLSDDFPVLLGDADNPFTPPVLTLIKDPSPEFSVTGNVTYTGYKTGAIYVGVFNSSTFDADSLVAYTSISETGSYTITGVPAGSAYYLAAFRDSDGGGNLDIDDAEARGCIDSVDVSGDLAGQNIVITDGGNYFNQPKLTPTNMDMRGVIYNALDEAIADGDEVAAFVDDGQGGQLLVGYGVYGEYVSGGYGLIHVYGDDTTTTEKDGALAGDIVTLKTYNQNEGMEYPLMLISGDNTWADGVEKVCDWKYHVKQRIPLHKGWNLISFGVNNCYYVGTQPAVSLIDGIVYEEVSGINDILSSIDGQYSYVRGFDVTGAKSYNLTPWSDMKYMTAGYGYWIKVNDDAAVDENGLIYLELEGSRVAGNKPVLLQPGWNLVGYLGNKVQYKGGEPTVPFPEDAELFHLDSDNVDDIFSSIAAKYSYVRGFDVTGAKSYNLTPWSDMKYVGPGYGCWIKVNEGESPSLVWED